jgi:uncharacterized small protein (DUF1192 family)
MTIGRAMAMIAELLPDEQDEWNPVKIKNTIAALCAKITRLEAQIERLKALTDEGGS